MIYGELQIANKDAGKFNFLNNLTNLNITFNLFNCQSGLERVGL